jgi:hypothetical protein
VKLSRLIAWLLLMAPSAWAAPLDLSSGHIPFVASLTTLFQVGQPAAGGITYTPAGGSFAGGTVTSPILFPNGSAAAPSVAGSSFTTTGLYWAAGPTLGFSTGGTSAFTINSSQQIAWTSGATLQNEPNIAGALFGSGVTTVVDIGLAGTPMIRMNGTTQFGWASGSASATVLDTILTRAAAATIQMGAADAAAPVAQTLKVQSVVAGTADTTGVKTTIVPSLGTGLGHGSAYAIQRALVQATGTVQQSAGDAFLICESRTLSTTTATLTTLATIALPTSNTAGGASAFFSVEAIDAVSPHVDDDTQIMNFAFKNIAGTVTANASAAVGDIQSGDLGTTTVGATATISTTNVLVNVTPVFTTIAPTIVHGYLILQLAGPVTATCN